MSHDHMAAEHFWKKKNWMVIIDHLANSRRKFTCLNLNAEKKFSENIGCRWWNKYWYSSRCEHTRSKLMKSTVALCGSLNNWADKTSQWFRKNDNKGNGGVVVGKWGMGQPWHRTVETPWAWNYTLLGNWHKIRHICED